MVFWSFLRLLAQVLGVLVVGAVLVWSLRTFGWQEVFAYAAMALAGVMIGSHLFHAVLRRLSVGK
jgi:DMSO reductase anchor subunit